VALARRTLVWERKYRKRAEVELARAIRHIERLEKELVAVRTSRSWRVGAPVRMLGRWLRRLMGRPIYKTGRLPPRPPGLGHSTFAQAPDNRERLRRWARRLPAPPQRLIRWMIVHLQGVRNRFRYRASDFAKQVEFSDEEIESLKHAAVARLEMLERLQNNEPVTAILSDLPRPTLRSVSPETDGGYWACQIVQLEDEIEYLANRPREGGGRGCDDI